MKKKNKHLYWKRISKRNDKIILNGLVTNGFFCYKHINYCLIDNYKCEKQTKDYMR